MLCQSQNFPTEKNRFSLAFSLVFKKKTSALKKSQNFKIWFQKIKLSTLRRGTLDIKRINIHKAFGNNQPEVNFDDPSARETRQFTQPYQSNPRSDQ